ncbi:MAG: hypothetical protein QW413_01470 [Nitrososphaerota archaeon]
MNIVQNWSISSIVKTLVELDPYILSGLSRGYVNLSALARLLKPTVEDMLKRPIKTDAIVTSLKRLRKSQEELSYPVARVVARSRLNIKSDLSRLSIKRTVKNRQIVRDLTFKYRRRFFQALEGLSSITLIYDVKYHLSVKRHFLRHSIIDESVGLVALMIVSPIEITSTPGVLSLILAQLSIKGINVEEIISCNTDTIIVVKAEDGGKTFDAVTELIQRCRRLISAQVTH